MQIQSVLAQLQEQQQLAVEIKQQAIAAQNQVNIKNKHPEVSHPPEDNELGISYPDGGNALGDPGTFVPEHTFEANNQTNETNEVTNTEK